MQAHEKRLLAQQLVEGGAGHELHGDEERPEAAVEVVDVHDSRVRERRRSARLALEAPERLGGVLAGVEDLDGHRPSEALVEGLVDHPHAAPAESLAEDVTRGGITHGGRGSV